MLSHFSRVQLFAALRTVASQAPLSMGFFSKNTGVGCHILLQGIFPTQGWNLRFLQLLHCRWILDCLATREAHTHMYILYIYENHGKLRIAIEPVPIIDT